MTTTDGPPVPTTVPDARVAGGAVVAHLRFTTRRFLGSPSLVCLSGGGYLATHDVFGRDSPSSETYVYRSSDGERWEQIGTLDNLFWAGLFEHRGAVYLLGCTTEYGHLVIRRSIDDGVTWTAPRDASSGLLLADGGYHTAPVPVVVHRGRVWRAYEQRLVGGNEWGHFGAAVLSADVDAELLDAASWTTTNVVEVPDELRSVGVDTWLEGNAVVAPTGEVVNVLRAHAWSAGHQQAAILSVSPDGTRLSVPDEGALVPMPGGGSKFTIRRDAGGTYWSLTNTALYDASPHRGLAARNTLSLIRSTDLRHWDVIAVVAHHHDDALHGFQYVDWRFEGVDEADILAVVRTAHAFEEGEAHSYHDSNLITCHRLRDYRGMGC